MPNLMPQYELTKNHDLRQRIRMASVQAAFLVLGEDQGTLPAAAYTKRQNLAVKVIATAGLGTPDDDVARMFVWAVCQNSAITSPEATDGDIEFTVSSVWSDCAGVTGADLIPTP
jgi:hypothetical protein